MSVGVCALLLTTAGAQAAPPASYSGGHLKTSAVHKFTAPALRLDPRVEAYGLVRHGQPRAAVKVLRAALASAPRDVALWRMLGDVLFRQNDAEQALGCWEEALAQRPFDLDLLGRVSRAAVRVGDLERAAAAEAALVQQLRGYAKWSHGQQKLGGYHASMQARLNEHLSRWSEIATLAGDFTTGERAARALMRRDPAGVEGRLALAYMHLQAAELDEAEELYAEVLEVEPANTVALNNLGNVRYMGRDLDGAAEKFEAILEAPQASNYSASLALANLAELLQLQGAFKDAERLYEQARETSPRGAWSYMGLASLYDLTGRYDEAVEVMIDGWERDSNHLTRLNMRFYEPEWVWQRDALIAEIEGEPMRAIKLWSRIAKGQVEGLRASASHHLRGLRGAD